MEYTQERIQFDKTLTKLEDLGSTLKWALNFGGVDANSLNRMKEAAEELSNLDFGSFIMRWLKEDDARGHFQGYFNDIYKTPNIASYQVEEKRLSDTYVDIADKYERVRNTIILFLSKQLKDDERVDEKGNIYKVNTEEINDEFGHIYRIDKLIEEPPKETPKEKIKKNFRDCILIDDKDGLLKVLHRLIDGKIGKFVTEVIWCCLDKGLIKKPTFPQVQEEFGNIGNKTGYHKYMATLMFSPEEIAPIQELLKGF